MLRLEEPKAVEAELFSTCGTDYLCGNRRSSNLISRTCMTIVHSQRAAQRPDRDTETILHQYLSQLPHSRRKQCYRTPAVLLYVRVRTLVAKYVARRERCCVRDALVAQSTLAVLQSLDSQTPRVRRQQPRRRHGGAQRRHRKRPGRRPRRVPPLQEPDEEDSGGKQHLQAVQKQAGRSHQKAPQFGQQVWRQVRRRSLLRCVPRGKLLTVSLTRRHRASVVRTMSSAPMRRMSTPIQRSHGR